MERFKDSLRQPGGSLGVTSLSAIIDFDRCAIGGGHMVSPCVRSHRNQVSTVFSGNHPTASISSAQGRSNSLIPGGPAWSPVDLGSIIAIDGRMHWSLPAGVWSCLSISRHMPRSYKNGSSPMIDCLMPTAANVTATPYLAVSYT